MDPQKYSLTFACYNQVEYTRLCIESMQKHGPDLTRLVVVDNGSTDDTRSYLATLPLGGLILNRSNLGCGVAWNQGVLALQAEWSIIMNNDVLVSPQWVENLIAAAERNNVRMISPALIEGKQDYDFDAFAADASQKMRDVLQTGVCHAVCLAVHQSVWMELGYFQPVPKLLGYEDSLFFHAAEQAGIPMAITGTSWLHHFGSITQKAMKQERGLAEKEGLGNRYNYRLLQQSWLARKLDKMRRKRERKAWRDAGIANYGMSLHGLRVHGKFVWL
jgi:GT2 family glycosyltransferase